MVTGSPAVVLQAASVRRGLDGAILHQLLHQLVEAHRIAVQRGGVALRARHLQQLADQGVEAVRFLLYAVERDVGIVAGAGQFDGDTEAGERGAEFVGDVEQQPAFGGEQRFDAVGHAVEGAGELAQFVAPYALRARAEIAPAEAFHRLLQFADRPREVQRQPVAQADGGEHDEEVRRLQEPGAHMGARHDEEEPEAAVVGTARRRWNRPCGRPGRARGVARGGSGPSGPRLVSRSRPFSSVRTPRASYTRCRVSRKDCSAGRPPIS
jgi:hypothetical protein